MLVRDIMTTDLVTVDAERSVQRAAEQLLRNRVGSAIVVEDGTPMGIVTESDVIRAGYLAERSFSEIAVSRVMSDPLVTVTEATTVQKAIETMREHSIKKLPVAQNFELHGIITTTDIALQEPALIKEAARIEEGRQDWERDRSAWEFSD